MTKDLKTLGNLEAEIMEVLWDKGESCVREVLFVLGKKKKIAYTTIMTVMSRLYDKGILKRKMDKSGAFNYLPALAKKEFLQKSSEKLIKSFIKEYGDVAVAQFIDIIENSDLKNSDGWKNKLKGIIG